MFGVEKFWVEKFGLKCPDPNTVAAVLLSTDSNMYDDSCLILSYSSYRTFQPQNFHPIHG